MEPATWLGWAQGRGLGMHGNGIRVAGGVERLLDALAASHVVGIWDWDHVRGHVVYDAGAAALLTGDPGCADRELHGYGTIACVHPADHAWLVEHMGRAVRRGGLVLAEYRVVDASGGVRWLLSRGRTEHHPAGRPVRSSGILIDITEVRESGERYIVGSTPSAADGLEQAVERAIQLKRGLCANTPSDVRTAADLLLLTLGQAIARVQRDSRH